MRFLTLLPALLLTGCLGEILGGDDGKGGKGNGGNGQDDGDDGDDEVTEPDPYSLDSDEDGLSDGDEIDRGLDPEDADSDDDGVDDGEEDIIGSDPADADSDDDSFSDGAEVESNTDPTDGDDHPYEGGWDIGACRNDIESTGGYDVGDVPENFSLKDQFGETVQLYDFCDKTVYILFQAFW